MKTTSGVIPWAIVTVAAGGAIWWSLSRDSTAGKWLFGGILFAHGLVHLLFALPEPEANGPDWPFDMGRSWAITGAHLNPNLVKGIGWVLIAVAVAGFALAALSTVGIVVPAGWWQGVVATASIASAVMLAVFFHPQLVLGFGIDVVLVWVAVTGAWAP